MHDAKPIVLLPPSRLDTECWPGGIRALLRGRMTVRVGDVFSIDVGGDVALCRVVAAEKPRGAWDNEGRWRVVTCAWSGPRADLQSALQQKDALAPLRLTRLRGQAHVQSIGGSPPPEFRKVAEYPPSADDRRIGSPRSPGAWQWIANQVRAELEFRADPRKVKAASASAARERKLARAKELRAIRATRRARPKVLGKHDAKALTKLGSAKLTEWRTHPRDFVNAVRAELKEFARALATAPTVTSVVAALEEATRTLNGIDAKWDSAVTTPDAEELVELLVNLAVAAGLDDEFAAQTVDRIRTF
jgi:hypothetical protein